MANQMQRAYDGQLGAWYNNWGDLWGDVKAGAQWLSHAGNQAQSTANSVNNAANNAANLTSWRVDVSTVALGALAVGAIMYATRRRR